MKTNEFKETSGYYKNIHSFCSEDCSFAYVFHPPFAVHRILKFVMPLFLLYTIVIVLLLAASSTVWEFSFYGICCEGGTLQ
jgi:hypothetical protein